MSGMCGCLCSSSGHDMCPLCGDYIPGEDWLDGKHRWQCSQRNTAKLSTFPAHPSVQCDRCDGKIRLWPPGHKFRCSSAPGLCVTAEHGVKIKNVGKNRYYCYPCDYNLCLGCVERLVKEKSQQVQLVNCLQELCDKVRDRVESKVKQEEEQEQDDIPLIDDEHHSGYHSPVPIRGSSITPTNFALPVKHQDSRPQELSPDVFQLRAPIVSWESLVSSFDSHIKSNGGGETWHDTRECQDNEPCCDEEPSLSRNSSLEPDADDCSVIIEHLRGDENQNSCAKMEFNPTISEVLDNKTQHNANDNNMTTQEKCVKKSVSATASDLISLD